MKMPSGRQVLLNPQLEPAVAEETNREHGKSRCAYGIRHKDHERSRCRGGALTLHAYRVSERRHSRKQKYFVHCDILRTLNLTGR